MRRLKLTLAYDGTDFSGWQVQVGPRTVQGVLEATLEKITGRAVRVTASGRTDAGVHARGQVAAFATDSQLPADVLLKALNAELPDDITIISASDVPEGFDPIRDAVRKHYRYVLNDGPVRDVFAQRYCWHCYPRLDVPAVQRAAAALVGTHDFRSFESSGAERGSTVRTVYLLQIEREVDASLRDANRVAEQRDYLTDQRDSCAGRIVLDIEADGYLYNMVRAIVGTLVEVGRGVRPESFPAEALAAQNRQAAGPTAPPQGLFLMRVDY